MPLVRALTISRHAACALAACAQSASDKDSRVPLGEQQVGLPLGLRVDFRIHPQDRSHEKQDNWLQEQGIGRLDFLPGLEDRSEAVLNQALDG
jgi:hypothetical protein